MKDFSLGVRDFLIYTIPGIVFIFFLLLLLNVFDVKLMFLSNFLITGNILSYLFLSVFGYIIGIIIDIPISILNLDFNRKVLEKSIRKNLEKSLWKEKYLSALQEFDKKQNIDNTQFFWFMKDKYSIKHSSLREHIERINSIRNFVYNLMCVFIVLSIIFFVMILINSCNLNFITFRTGMLYYLVMLVLPVLLLWKKYISISDWLVNTVIRAIALDE